MKNFKLLLATTAILSMGAMGVKAFDPINVSGDGAELKAFVQLVQPIKITVNGSLDFGIISSAENGSYVKIDTTGEVTTNATRISDRAQRASIHVAYSEAYSWRGDLDDRTTSTSLKLQLPTEIRLVGDNNALCGYVDEIAATNNGWIQTAGGSMTTDFGIGGKFTVKAKDGESLNLSHPRSCSGSGIVTAVLIDGD